MRHHRYYSPLALPRNSIQENEQYQLIHNGDISWVSAHDFDIAHNVDGDIRILDDEYPEIDTSLKFYTHFNMEFGGHRIGKRYGLPHIIKQGYFRSQTDEVLPLCSFDNSLVATCVQVREHIPYRSLQDSNFEFSMKHIKNISDLKGAILKRYKVSLPNLSEEEILSFGVGITVLQLDGYFK